MARLSKSGAASRAAVAVLGAIAACLVLPAAPALAGTTETPELIAPVASTFDGNPLAIEYRLPEPGSAGEIEFAPVSGSPVTVTLTAAAVTAGLHHFHLNMNALASETANVKEASASTLPPGEYTVVLKYQDAGHDPAATASAEKVPVKAATTAPTLTEPTAGHTYRGEPFAIGYVLPEAAAPGTVVATLVGAHSGAVTLTLTGTSKGVHTAQVVPSQLGTGSGVASASAQRLPSDEYKLVLSYQDVYLNPAASAEPLAVTVRYPYCAMGYYGTGGEEPCTKAPAGSYVSTSGSSSPTPCPAGYYSPLEGAILCTAAAPGHYAPGTGATGELECEQGTYSDETRQTSCLPVPAGHYGGRGTAFPVPCPAGTHDPHVNSPSLEFCEADAPGSYSGEGAAEATLCEAGYFAEGAKSEECTPAEPGHYVEVAGASSQRPCPAGSYAASIATVRCTTTPAGTYATGGAIGPTACPAGTESGPGAAACSAVAPISPAIAPGIGQAAASGTASTPGHSGPATPAPAPVVSVKSAKHGVSLRHGFRQRLGLTCTANVDGLAVQVTATVRAGRRRVVLSATVPAVSCRAGSAAEVVAKFGSSTSARRLAGAHGASVRLAVVVSDGSAMVGRGSLRGRP